MAIQVVQPGQTRQRFHRRPNFPIAGTMKPFGLYPIMCHPVLPGETLKSATTKWSVVSMPVKNPLAGAWLETWLFYVKLTDIDQDLGNMFISDSYSSSGWTSASDLDYEFTKTGQIQWIGHCLNRIMIDYFSNENEGFPYIADNSQNIAQVKLNNVSWYQNMMFEPAETALDTSGPRDAHEQLKAWEMLQQMQMTELTYERYLEQYGVKAQRFQAGMPEILRYSRSWTRPRNHIDQSTGTPTSAWVWDDEMKAEKDKRFVEPGFIFQVATIRPKMYQAMLRYSMVGNLWGFSDWFPAYNLTDPSAGVRNISTDDPVFDTSWNGAEGADELLYDHRDLLSHGEQFVNDWTNLPYALPMSTQMSGLAAADTWDVRGEYCNVTDVNNLFSGATEATRRCYYEGMTSLVIAGHTQDTTR